MSLTIYASQYPRMSTGTNVIMAKSTTSGVYKFRFYLEVDYFVSGETDVKTVKFTQPRNSNGFGVFNMSEIYKNIVTPMIRPCELRDEKGTTTPSEIVPIHNIGFSHAGKSFIYSRPFLDDSTGWGAFQGLCNKAVLRFYEMYSNTSGGVPSVDTGSVVSKTNYVFWGRGERNQSFAFGLDEYSLSSTGKKFLTNNYKYDKSISRWVGYLSSDDYMTMSFANGHSSYGNNSTDTYEVLFRYYNSSGVEIGTALACKNTAQTGGKYGGVQGQSNTGRSFFLTIGCGLRNLNEIDTSQADYSGDNPLEVVLASGQQISYYEMYARNSSSVRISMIYRFYITTPCPKYEQTRLAYMNKFGCWEYINLNKEKQVVTKVKRETINKPVVHSETPDNTTDAGVLYNTYPSNMPHQGTKVVKMEFREELTLFTQNLDDSELDRINDLIKSPQIHMNEGGDQWIALICKTDRIENKIKGVSKLYSYQLRFEYAEPKYRTTN